MIRIEWLYVPPGPILRNIHDQETPEVRDWGALSRDSSGFEVSSSTEFSPTMPTAWIHSYWQWWSCTGNAWRQEKVKVAETQRTFEKSLCSSLSDQQTADFQVNREKFPREASGMGPWESRESAWFWHEATLRKIEAEGIGRCSCSKSSFMGKNRYCSERWLWLLPGSRPCAALLKQRVNRSRVSIYTALVTKHGFLLERYGTENQLAGRKKQLFSKWVDYEPLAFIWPMLKKMYDRVPGTMASSSSFTWVKGPKCLDLGNLSLFSKAD